MGWDGTDEWIPIHGAQHRGLEHSGHRTLRAAAAPGYPNISLLQLMQEPSGKRAWSSCKHHPTSPQASPPLPSVCSWSTCSMEGAKSMNHSSTARGTSAPEMEGKAPLNSPQLGEGSQGGGGRTQPHPPCPSPPTPSALPAVPGARAARSEYRQDLSVQRKAVCPTILFVSCMISTRLFAQQSALKPPPAPNTPKWLWAAGCLSSAAGTPAGWLNLGS